MEKCLNSAIATTFAVLLLFAYLLPYYVPDSLAQSIDNGSPTTSIINGSISGIPAGTEVTLFIVNEKDNSLLTFPIPHITGTFRTLPVSADDNDTILFRINGKDSGTIKFHPGTTLTVQLIYTPPGSEYTYNSPVTPAPFKINVTATPTVTVTPEPTSIPTNTAIASPVNNTPTASATAPTPTGTSVNYLIIIGIFIGIIIVLAIIVYLWRRG